MRVGFTFNVRHEGAGLDGASQAEAEFDEPATIRAIHDAIEANGHDCIDVEADTDAFETLRSLVGEIDLVFNIAEGQRGEVREAQIPAILEMLGIPHTHSSALTQAVTLDKTLTKKIWRYHGLPTPPFVLFGNGLEAETVEVLRFPVLVKPNAEGSSKGLFNDNFIEEPDALLAKVEEIHSLVGGKMLAEQFLPGREFTVSVLGNLGVGNGLYTLPIVEQNFDLYPEHLRHFASYEVKWFFEDSPEGKAACLCPTEIDDELRVRVEELCKRAFAVLGCRDIARVDLRLNEGGEPQLLEVNTMPGMHHDPELTSYYPVAARAAGWNYERIVGQIIGHAAARLGLGLDRDVLIPELAPVETDQAPSQISW